MKQDKNLTADYDGKSRVQNFLTVILWIGMLILTAVIVAAVLYTDSSAPAADPAETIPAVIQTQIPTEESVETEETQAPDPEDDLLSIDTYIPAEPVDDGSDGFYDSGEFIWNRMSFSMFYGDENSALRYARSMNTASETLGENVQVYSLIAPLHTEFGLPERFKTGENAIDNNSAAEYMRTAYSAMDSSVIPVNPYNMLSAHCNEYIYFGSDHHWTALGAYYAYTAFAKTAGLPALDLNDCEENTIDGFTGSFYKLVSAELDKDTVHYWKFSYDVTDTITDANGKTTTYDSCYFDDIYGAGDGSYLIFINGDQPLEVLRSSSEEAKSEKIAVIHESYGNAFIPYLTYNFEEVYSIDFRYFKGDISDFCEENGITNVLFLNNVMSSATLSALESMEELL